MSLNDITASLIDSSDLDFDNCTLPEVIGFVHNMSRDPHTSTLNLAFTEHITDALIEVREDKLRLECSIPRKLEDSWDPMIKIKLNNFSCFALCDVGASTLLEFTNLSSALADGKALCRLPPHGKAPVSHFFGKEVPCRLQEIDGRQTTLSCVFAQADGRAGVTANLCQPAPSGR